MSDSTPIRSVWPHLWAWVLCIATFPLLWVGGLITTTDAGMAVPDWPGTYGYNLLLYPWMTWLFGPWDLFIEHGHRLFASGVGLLTIVFTIVVWRCDERPWLRRMALVALALVIFQGVLGGVRVWMNERNLALAHGSTGPIFFALTAALVVLTRRDVPPTTSSRSKRWLWLLPTLIYVQLILGAAMRHTPEDSSFSTFAQHVQAHLIQAAIVCLMVLATLIVAWRQPKPAGGWLTPLIMTGLLAVQLSLGMATWVAKYHLPRWANTVIADTSASSDAWAETLSPVTMHSSTAGGWIETHTVTAHSACGSLLLALATAHAVLAWRQKSALETTSLNVSPDTSPN